MKTCNLCGGKFCGRGKKPKDNRSACPTCRKAIREGTLEAKRACKPTTGTPPHILERMEMYASYARANKPIKYVVSE